MDGVMTDEVKPDPYLAGITEQWKADKAKDTENTRQRPAVGEDEIGDMPSASSMQQFTEEYRNHPDARAVDRFAKAMKLKLWMKRNEGKGGWDNPDACTVEFLAQLLVEHVAKGDSIDVANFAMMLHQRGATHDVLANAALIARAPAIKDYIARIRELEAQRAPGSGEVAEIVATLDKFEKQHNPHDLLDMELMRALPTLRAALLGGWVEPCKVALCVLAQIESMKERFHPNLQKDIQIAADGLRSIIPTTPAEREKS
jgi:hypothetical protein